MEHTLKTALFQANKVSFSELETRFCQMSVFNSAEPQLWSLASSHTMPVLPSGHGSHVYPAHVSRVPGPDGHVARDTCPSDTAAKLSLSRYSDLGQQSYTKGRRIGAEVSGVRRKLG